MNMQMLALGFLASTAIGGLAWVFIYPALSGENKAESRRAQIARPEPTAARQADKSQRSRREQVEGSLKDLEARHKKEKSVPLSTRITRAGRAMLPTPDVQLDAGDILHVSATLPGIEALRERAAPSGGPR